MPEYFYVLSSFSVGIVGNTILPCLPIDLVLAVLQFSQHAGPRASLLSTASGVDGRPLDLVEAAPHDFFWGRGVDNTGSNHLGVLLMRVRNELLASSNGLVEAASIKSIRPHPLDSIVSTP